MTDRTDSVATENLPTLIRDFLAHHVAREIDATLACYTPDAVVVDEGNSYRGHDEIAGWMRRVAAEYTYTVELIASHRIDDTHWLAVQHLEGNFPGNVVDLRFEFTLRDGRIAALTIV